MSDNGNSDTNKGIIILGQRFPLGDPGVNVVTWKDDPNWGFEGIAYSKMSNGQTGTYFRKDKKGKIRLKYTEENMARLREKLKMVLLHTDLTADSRTCWRVLAQRGLSTHFMINWDGTIFQGADVGKTTIHGGDVNSISVGIDLNSLMKNLRNPKWSPSKDPANKQMYRDSSRMYFPERTTWGELSKDIKRQYNRPIFPKGGGIMRLENGARVRAYGYTDAQYRALVALLQLLIKEKLLPLEMPWLPGMQINKGLVPEKEGWRGIVGHWHVSTQRWDPGPGFDWERVWAMLRNQGNAFPVTLADGANISALREPSKVKARAKLYYDLNQKGSQAIPKDLRRGPAREATYGWFPMGPNQTWNGGILLQSKQGEAVRAVTNGTVIAARNNPKNARWGSANFVLVRHEVLIPRAPKRTRSGRKKKKKKAIDDKFIFWSLYMHLDYVDMEKTPADKLPGWMQRLVKEGEEGKKKKKKKKKRGGDDEDDDDILDTLNVPGKVGAGLAALKKGFISTFDEEEIGVGAGEPIGKVGLFGMPTDQFEDASDYMKAQVRVSIFADDRWTRAVDMSVHGKYFLLRSQPKISDRSLLLKNPDILQAFRAASPTDTVSSSPLSKDRVLSSDAIREVYQGEDTVPLANRLHQVVSHHVSEWSDQVNWWRSLTDAQEWASELIDVKKLVNRSGFFKRAFQDVMPFVWLNKEVAQKVGIAGSEEENWSGYLWHFHPIYFLLWLTYKAAPGEKIKFSRKLTRKERKARRKLEKQAAKNEEDRERGFDDCAGDGESGGTDGTDCVYESLDFVVDDSVDVRNMLDDWFEMAPDEDDWEYEQAEED